MESQKKQALIVALRLLTATAKSSKELEGKLQEKGFSPAVILDTLQDLKKQGFLNDAAYAKNLASRLTVERPSGRHKIDFELKRHKVPAPIREEILAGLSPDGERAKARELAQERWESFKNLPLEKRKKRTYDYLIRRGFEFQVARDLIEEMRSLETDENRPNPQHFS